MYDGDGVVVECLSEVCRNMIQRIFEIHKCYTSHHLKVIPSALRSMCVSESAHHGQRTASPTRYCHLIGNGAMHARTAPAAYTVRTAAPCVSA
jgi:hypothetical protein